jgi:hypothetical protein
MEATFIKIGLVVLGLVIVGLALTAYEFREHIIKHFQRKNHKH